MKIVKRLRIFQLDQRYTIIQSFLDLGENGRIQNQPKAENSENDIFKFYNKIRNLFSIRGLRH